MNYIVLDLEWNQCPDGKENENPQLPFEIIEIGAHKINACCEILDSFHAMIKPVVYEQMNIHTQEIIGISSEELKQGVSFRAAASSFLAWCGEDYSFATWGAMDLTELQRNMKYFQVENPFPRPLLYYDIQKLYSLCQGNPSVRKSLETAAEELSIPKDISFHRADADTFYTVKVMQSIDMAILKKYVSVDYFYTPKSKQEELHLHFDTYYKYVSREFNSKEEAMSDKTVAATRCYICQKPIKKKIRWFSCNNRIYYSLMYCPVHGWVKGKIRMKKNEDGKFFAVKTIKLTDENGAEKIRITQEELRRRKRERRRLLKSREKKDSPMCDTDDNC